MSDDSQGPTAEDWVRVARQHRTDAGTLIRARSYQNAYMLAGLAVEFALKGRIMHQERLNAWPDRSQRPELYVHNLSRLMEVSGLREQVEREISDLSAIGQGWMVVKDFDINRRYPLRAAFPMRLAKDFVSAIDDQGLIEWLIRGIS